jgi:aspartyl-tRNA(Asn)/glutamyl-tRNA(Gln) amidotransferase subunit B
MRRFSRIPSCSPALPQISAARTGLCLKTQINRKPVFDRKNYFYPDLPQGYQISQFTQPIVGKGTVLVSVGPDRQGYFENMEIGIERLHLEQDAGKSIHDQHPAMSYVYLNRSGVALMEIVSKPDLRSAGEAKAYVTKLRMILRYLETCDGNMDEGSMRAALVGADKPAPSRSGTRSPAQRFLIAHSARSRRWQAIAWRRFSAAPWPDGRRLEHVEARHRI